MGTFTDPALSLYHVFSHARLPVYSPINAPIGGLMLMPDKLMTNITQ